ncbi:MAG TPA: hypothetical protein VK970_08675, partial [Candidatus Methylacidiphilales bacterium]|nr:hypothetical protein [Candidatus Methylacidiphilales bacterium]
TRRMLMAAVPGILPVVALYAFTGNLVTVLMCYVVALVAWYVFSAGVRFRRPRVMRNRIIPLLARALAPLHPSRRELDDVLKMMNELNHEIGTRIQASELLVAMPQFNRRRRHQRDQRDQRDAGPC